VTGRGLAIVAPGQGAQTPGFLAPWLSVDGVADRMARLSDAARTDLVAHGTASDADTIRDTAVAQPLLVAAGLVALHALQGADDEDDVLAGLPGVAAGHSVGEIVAVAGTGVLTDAQAMGFVRERSRAMAEAAAATATGMTAVLGGDTDEVLAVLERHGLTAANANGGGQVVAAGTTEQLAALAADPPARARLMPLQVAGAFHTHHMAPAVDVLAAHAAGLSPRDPAGPLLSNRDGAVVTSGRDALDRLVAQVASPVRWDRCQATLAGLGVSGLLELPPAGTLVGLARRGLPGVATFALKTPDQLDAAREFVSTHRADAPS
jgi:[acyl-carrier-protein] S-malonyltransferase